MRAGPDTARPLSDEEIQLRKRARRRLIGAVVLVTAVAVLLPMVLDSEPKPVSQEVNIKIPSPDASGFSSRIVPTESAAGKPAKPPAAEAVAAAPAPKAVPAEAAAKKAEPGEAAKPQPSKPAPESRKPEPPKPAPPKAEPPPKPAPAKTEAAPKPPATGGFAIQVVALADAAKAKAMQQQIAAAGIPSYTEAVKTAQGEVTRVRAGPFATREAAEKAQAQLKAIGLEGKIAPR
jgi:DedD protein